MKNQEPILAVTVCETLPDSGTRNISKLFPPDAYFGDILAWVTSLKLDPEKSTITMSKVIE